MFKFKKLEINNLASIQQATINFDQAPLSDSDVFLITGKTGSGKSTILDAICLALFNKTPRLQANRSFENTTYLDETTGNTNINDPIQLLSRGETKGSAKLTFEGHDGVVWTATWTAYQKRENRNRRNGDTHTTKWELANEDGSNVISNTKAIEKNIVEILGLDYEQFCRTTMLAQGEFTKFLKSDDKDKSEILERITGTNIYTLIGKKIFEKTKYHAEKLKAQQQRMADTKLLSSEETDEKKQQIERLNTERDQHKAQKDKLNDQRQWLARSIETNNKLAQSEQDVAAARQAVSDLDPQRATVNDWHLTAEPRQNLALAEQARTGINSANKQLASQAVQLQLALAGIANLQASKQKTHDRWQGLQSRQQAKEPYRPILDNSQTIVANIGSFTDKGDEIAKNEQKRNDQHKKLQQLAQKEQEQQQAASDAQQDVEAKTAASNQLQEQLEQMHLPQLHKQHDGLNARLNAANTSEQSLKSWHTAKSDLEKARENLAESEERKSKIASALPSLEEAVGTAKKLADARKEAFENLSRMQDKFLVALRGKLHQGDVCPLCQQKVQHVLPAEEVDGMIRVADSKLKEAQDEHGKAQNALNEAQAQIGVLGKNIEQQRKSVDELTGRVSACADKVAADLQAMPLDEALKHIAATRSELQASIDQVKTSITAAEELEKRVKASNSELDKSKTAWDTAKEKLAKTQRDKAALSASTEAIVRQIGEAQQQQSTLAQGIDSALQSNVEWLDLWHTSPSDAIATLKAEAASLKEVDAKLQKEQEKLNAIQGEIETALKLKADAIGLMPNWDQLAPATSQAEINLQSTLTNVIVNTAKAKQELDQATDAHKENSEQLEAFLADHDGITRERLGELAKLGQQQVAQLEDSLQQAERKKTEAETTLRNLRDEQAQLQQSRPQQLAPDATTGDLDAAIETEQQAIDNALQQIGSIQKELETNQENLLKFDKLATELEAIKSEHSKWEALNNTLGDATGSKLRRIAQSYILQSLMQKANDYLAHLTPRYKLHVVPGKFIILIEDAYQGNARRAANTISGGESFIVSLALALALSDLSGSNSVNTLFIDEGFGTLSAEHLQDAIATLQRLHHLNGRHVGIISHVEELRERIPLQISITQIPGTGSSKVEVNQL